MVPTPRDRPMTLRKTLGQLQNFTIQKPYRRRRRSTSSISSAVTISSNVSSNGPESKTANLPGAIRGLEHNEIPTAWVRTGPAYYAGGHRREDFLKKLTQCEADDLESWKFAKGQAWKLADPGCQPGRSGPTWTPTLEEVGETAERPQPLSIEQPEGADEYEVDHIVAEATDSSGASHYLLHWKNWKAADSTWQLAKTVRRTAPLLCERFRLRTQALRHVMDHLTDDQKINLKKFEFTTDMKAWNLMRAETKSTWKLLQIEGLYNEASNAAGLPPIWVENWSVAERFDIPSSFQYITENITSARASAALKALAEEYHAPLCVCTDGCSSRATACCLKASDGIAFKPIDSDPVFRIVESIDYTPILQCGPDCRCNRDNCTQRVLTDDGRPIPLILFYEGRKGYGIRTPVRIPKGAFVGEYVGEVLTAEEADEPTRGTIYQHYLMKGHAALGGERLVVDAMHYGNAMRFINHSCDPNVVTQYVLWDRHGAYNAKVAFIAIRTIQPGEELTCDFQPNVLEPLGENGCFMRCLCGAARCKKFLAGTARED